jgi:hypothetical protein
MTSQSPMSDIMREIDRYRVASVELLIRTLPMESQEKTLRTLGNRKELELSKLASGDTCIYRRSPKPPNELSKAKFVAIHSCCSDSATRRRLLNKSDIQEYFPSLARVGLPFGYTIDLSSEQPVLSLLRVDTRLESVDRIRQQVFALLKRHASQPAFNVLIRRNQFEVCFLFATQSKAQSIFLSLTKHRQTSTSINAIHVPVLLELLKPLQHCEHSPT